VHRKSPLLPGVERHSVNSGATRITWERCASLLMRHSSQTLSSHSRCSMGFQNPTKKNPAKRAPTWDHAFRAREPFWRNHCYQFTPTRTLIHCWRKNQRSEQVRRSPAFYVPMANVLSDVRSASRRAILPEFVPRRMAQSFVTCRGAPAKRGRSVI
jgi:hypothetical protein